MAKNIWHSFLLTWQFFTSIPIKKELPLSKSTITGMFAFLPLIGACMGAFVALVLYILTTWTASSELLLAFLIVGLFAFLTGGLHLDGFIDMSDAFFSYREQEKRLAILDDPRVGAFGVLAVLFLVLGKLVIIHELLIQQQFALWMVILLPFLTRLGMIFYFLSLKCSRDKGLAAFFKAHILPNHLIAWLFVLVIIVYSVLYTIIGLSYVPALLLLVVVMVFWLFRQFTIRHFGGVSGDLLGASIEGMEAVLWVILLLCTY
ncbi:adenosylcobinamide-GDP ribazoletransferase [Lysinibacillus piscis]|uniref:Adenosylcobinamide-GDP ribazoletransferase n=1 Tax=Lysinibacillus piscis TaxID=2518931 RepID=A0ABQ5NKN9_9BACI|nr:adenosylcobinamide-GDP ribazoletransferase [Lysinibacillus sp. KH24]GLC88868.1 adenosylcobinamide-GDP ribazoletransferase [Lysinibacillus sp. KH24]